MDHDYGSDVIARVKKIDLSPVASRLNQIGYNNENVDNYVSDYRQFLIVLASNPNLTLVPTKTADIVWHEHILFMDKYEKDMMKLLGGRAFHHPEPNNTEIWQAAVANTRKAIRRNFNLDLPESDFAACLVSVKAA